MATEISLPTLQWKIKEWLEHGEIIYVQRLIEECKKIYPELDIIKKDFTCFRAICLKGYQHLFYLFDFGYVIRHSKLSKLLVKLVKQPNLGAKIFKSIIYRVSFDKVEESYACAIFRKNTIVIQLIEERYPDNDRLLPYGSLKQLMTFKGSLNDLIISDCIADIFENISDISAFIGAFADPDYVYGKNPPKIIYLLRDRLNYYECLKTAVRYKRIEIVKYLMYNRPTLNGKPRHAHISMKKFIRQSNIKQLCIFRKNFPNDMIVYKDTPEWIYTPDPDLPNLTMVKQFIIWNIERRYPKSPYKVVKRLSKTYPNCADWIYPAWTNYLKKSILGMFTHNHDFSSPPSKVILFDSEFIMDLILIFSDIVKDEKSTIELLEQICKKYGTDKVIEYLSKTSQKYHKLLLVSRSDHRSIVSHE